MSFNPDSEQNNDLLAALSISVLADKAKQIAQARFLNPSLPRDPDFQPLLEEMAKVLIEFLETQNNRDKAGAHHG